MPGIKVGHGHGHHICFQWISQGRICQEGRRDSNHWQCWYSLGADANWREMQRYPPVTWQGTIPYNWRFRWENRLWIMDFPLPRLIVEVHFTSWIREIAIQSISRLTTMLTRRHCSISYLYTNIYMCIYIFSMYTCLWRTESCWHAKSSPFDVSLAALSHNRISCTFHASSNMAISP